MTPSFDNVSIPPASDVQNPAEKSGPDIGAQERNTQALDGDNVLTVRTAEAMTVLSDAPEMAPGQSGLPLLRTPILLAQAAIEQTPGAVADSAPARILAEVMEAGANARLMRNGRTIALKPGDVVLDGDIIDVTTGATVKVAYPRDANASLTEELITSTIGENSRVQFRSEIANQVDSLSLKLIAGSIVIENIPDIGTRMSIDTPAGRVGVAFRDVGVTVNQGSGETTVMALAPIPRAMESLYRHPADSTRSMALAKVLSCRPKTAPRRSLARSVQRKALPSLV